VSKAEDWAKGGLPEPRPLEPLPADLLTPRQKRPLDRWALMSGHANESWASSKKAVESIADERRATSPHRPRSRA